MTWLDDITGYNLTAKDNINLGRIEGKTWAEVFGNLYVGNRERTKYLKYESLADGKNELSFVGDVIRAAAEEAYFQGSFIAQGYIGVGSETKVESVLVGMTAEDADVPSGQRRPDSVLGRKAVLGAVRCADEDSGGREANIQ